MEFKNHITFLSKSLLVLIASTSIATAGEIVSVDQKTASTPNQNPQEELKLITQMRAIYLSQGDLEAVDLLNKEIQKIKAAFTQLNQLSRIQIKSPTAFCIHALTTNAKRLSGKQSSTFSYVNDAIEGAHFTRVPQNSKNSFEFKALTSGYIYLTGAHIHSFEPISADLIITEDSISGKDLENCYKVYLQEGETYTIAGRETCLIGRTITRAAK